MRPKLTISRKLLIILTLVAVISAGTTSFIGHRTARSALEDQSFARLTAVREMKANQVEDYFAQISNQVMASGLSVEAQFCTILMAVMAPILGALADHFGVGAALMVFGLGMALTSLVTNVKSSQPETRPV